MMCKDLIDDAATVVDVKEEQEVRHRQDGLIGQAGQDDGPHAAVPSVPKLPPATSPPATSPPVKSKAAAARSIRSWPWVKSVMVSTPSAGALNTKWSEPASPPGK